MSKIVVLLGTVLLPGIAAAHPAHGSGGDFGVVHFLTDPFHVGLTAVAVLAFLAIRKRLFRLRSVDRPGR
ncbi:MAG: hypothetical protein ACQGVK_11765 [Myxococcota bacterium]